MRLPSVGLFLIFAGIVIVSNASAQTSPRPRDAGAAITTPRIEGFPKRPQGYQLINWRERSDAFVRFALDPSHTGEHMPLMWWDDTRIAGRETTFGLPSYVGMKNQWGVFQNAHEGFVTMGVLISGELLGRDMTRYTPPGSSQPVNLVRMQKEYFSPKINIFCDAINGDETTGETFFYELTPSMFVAPLCDKHPDERELIDRWKKSCGTWADVSAHLWGLNDYNFQSYDLGRRQAVVKQWREPDVAAGLAYLMLVAHAKFPEEKRFYEECHHSLMWLDKHPRNINYGLAAPFGVYAAARANAEHGSNYDVAKFFSWCFEASEVRGIGPHAQTVAEGDDYGIIAGRWGDVDVAGLVGASRIELVDNHKRSVGRGGYVFLMETCAFMWPLVPATRYDNRLARATGKWMHHAAHSARFFYPDQLAPEMQTNWDWASAHTTAIPYEGIKDRNTETGSPGPYGTGDPISHDWGPNNLGIYSGALSGVPGSIVRPTDSPDVLALDLRATDFFAPDGFPTTLLYNNGEADVTVSLSVGANPVRAWDAVGNRFLSKRVDGGKLSVMVPADDALIVTLIPADAKTHYAHGRLYADSKVVDYSVPAPKVK